MSRLNIVYLEDNVEDAEIAIREFNKTMNLLMEWELCTKMGFEEINIEWIKGTQPFEERGIRYKFYREEDIPVIRERIQQLSGEEGKTGILMDVILAKEEQVQLKSNPEPHIEFSKKIYDEYDENYGIYIITGLRNFGSRAWGIYGKENLSERYISRPLVNYYPSRKAMARALYWMYHKKPMEEKLLREIEERELMELD